MKGFLQTEITKVVKIEEVLIKVPQTANYISVDFTGCVKTWIYPVCFKDGWACPSSPDRDIEVGVVVGFVDRDHPDRLRMDIFEITEENTIDD